MPQNWVAIQRNPSSGAGQQAQPVLALIRALHQHGIVPKLYSRRDELDAAVTDPQRRESLLAIVAAGGDGTVLDLVHRHPALPLCVLPLGTENLLAKAFRIPRCGQAVADIIARGHRTQLDLGQLNGRIFLIMASCGFDAEVVHHVHARRKGGHVRHASYLLPIFNSLWNFDPPTLHVTVDDSPEVHEGQLVVVSNLSAYALNLGLVPTALGHDGFLDARIFSARSRTDLLLQLSSVLRGTHESSAGVIRLTGRRFHIESTSPAPLQTDGDPAGHTPAEINIIPHVVKLLVP